MKHISSIEKEITQVTEQKGERGKEREASSRERDIEKNRQIQEERH